MWIKLRGNRRRLNVVFVIVVALGLLPVLSYADTVTQEPSGHGDFVTVERCLECHTEHKGIDENAHIKIFFPKKGVEFARSCETCHGPGAAHVQAEGNREDPGFASIFGPTTSPSSLMQACFTCHSEEHPYWNSSTHARKGGTCNACHTIHKEALPGPDQEHLLKMKTSSETCFQCHRDKKALMFRVAHMPVKEGKMSCASCHNPHGTPHPASLKAASVNELCLSCHTEKQGPFLWEHAPVRENCLTCHEAHGSIHDKMLTSKRPYLLCQQCHVGTRHPSTLYDASAVTQQSNRIFNRSCQNCHVSIHGSNHPSGKFFLR